MPEAMEIPAVEATPAAEVEPENPANSETPESEAQATEEKKAKGVQKRIDELTANWRQAEREKEWMRQQLERAQQQPTQKPEPSTPAKPAADGRPTIDQFENVDDYTAAVAEWAIERAEKSREAKTQEQQQRAQQETFQRKAADQMKSGRQQFADFDEVVTNNPTLPITDHMAAALVEMEKGAEVAYHLGKNPQEAARIAQMPPMLQLAELGAIKATLAIKTKTVSEAPEPVGSQLAGGNAGGGEPKDIKAWMEWRNKQTQSPR